MFLTFVIELPPLPPLHTLEKILLMMYFSKPSYPTVTGFFSLFFSLNLFRSVVFLLIVKISRVRSLSLLQVLSGLWRLWLGVRFSPLSKVFAVGWGETDRKAHSHHPVWWMLSLAFIQKDLVSPRREPRRLLQGTQEVAQVLKLVATSLDVSGSLT